MRKGSCGVGKRISTEFLKEYIFDWEQRVALGNKWFGKELEIWNLGYQSLTITR